MPRAGPSLRIELDDVEMLPGVGACPSEIECPRRAGDDSDSVCSRLNRIARDCPDDQAWLPAAAMYLIIRLAESVQAMTRRAGAARGRGLLDGEGRGRQSLCIRQHDRTAEVDAVARTHHVQTMTSIGSDIRHPQVAAKGRQRRLPRS